MRVLVTGGAGYIGSHCVAELITRGFQVSVVDNFSTGHRELLHPQADLHIGNICDETVLQKIFQAVQPQVVFHFAAFTSVPESIIKPEKYYENNFGGTLSLLKVIEKYSPECKLIFSSTAAVYADPGTNKVHENSKISPPTAYGKSKWMSEQAIHDLSQSLDSFQYMILRYFNVAGASGSGEYGQIGDQHTILVKRAALAAVGKISEFEMLGTDYPTNDGTAVRDFIHVEDLVDLHIVSLKHLFGSGKSEILNCGYGRGFSVKQVVESMQRVSGKSFKVVEKPRRSGDLPQVIADNQKLLSLFSWKPRFNDLDLICRSAYEWEKSRNSRHL